MENFIKISDKKVGENQPCFVTAEVGINHNGSLSLAKKLIDIASVAGCDAVKFQKRTIDKVYTRDELSLPRQSIFGETNGDLKRGLEFGYDEYKEIDAYCKKKQIIWYASCWDKDSVDFIEQFNPPCYKIAAASLTDDELLKYTRVQGKPIFLSTGMSSMEQIQHAVEILGKKDLILYHCTSTYPTDEAEINLKVIQTLKNEFGCPVGYSGHERGLMPTVMSAVFGVVAIERHITNDRTNWGSDQAASLELDGIHRIVRDIRKIPIVTGDGIKKVYNSELPIIKKLRKV